MRTPASLTPIEPVRKQIAQALFIDVPYVLDSIARRTDYELNKRYKLERLEGVERWRVRPAYAAAVPLALTLVFALYGATFDALCSLFVASWRPWALLVLALAGVVAFVALALVAARALHMRYRKRIERLGKKGAVPRVRRVAFAIGLSLLLGVPLGLVASQLFPPLFHPATWAFDSHLCLGASVRGGVWFQIVAAVVLVAFAVLLGPRWIPRWRDRLAGCGLLASVWVGLYVLTDPSATEAAHGPYPTAFGALAAVLVATVCLLAAWAAPLVVRQSEPTYGPRLRRALQRCELFVERQEPQLSVDRVVYALVGAPLTQPLLLLVVPSFAAVVSGRRQLWWAWWIAFTIAWFVIALGSISTRWHWQITLARRWLLTGLPLILSIAVLGLALGRLFDFDYVAYVLDSAPFGAITLTLTMLYAMGWLLERALNEPLQAELLSVLEKDDWTRVLVQNEGIDRVRYDIDPDAIASRVCPEDRYIQIHGVGRFAVVGILAPGVSRSPDQSEGFHTYDKVELFEALVDSERAHTKTDAERRELDVLLDLVHGLRRRVSTYFAGINAGIALLLVIVGVWVRSADTNYTRRPLVVARSLPWQRSPVSAVSSREKEGFDLTGALLHEAERGRAAILVAASGGGTRAALFTTGALRGLEASGWGGDILLMSGVSGGGVSLAYFASHREGLVPTPQAPDVSAAWDDYVEAMSFPYIEDVLEGAGEFRMVRDEALGRLLRESFDRSFARDRHGQPLSGQVKAFGGLRIGLILNTTIASHPYSDSQLLRALFSSESGSEDLAGELAYARFTGGRLIFTNLNPAPFPQHGTGRGASDDFAPDIDLTYKVVQNPKASITAAAALNANFPPVFSNIGVWVSEDAAPLKKYYVTDGGVEENRGLVSLLYALEGALDQWPTDHRTPPPCIHIVSLEASAMKFDYSQDRGISAVFSSSAGERLASGLERQLLEDVEGRAKQLGGACRDSGDGASAQAVRLHYLVMPAVFTTRGGFGTHWMLPDSVRLRSPAEAEPGHFWERRESRDLARGQIRHLLFRCLFPAVKEPSDGECRELFGGCIPREWLGDTESCSSEPTDPPCVDGWRGLRESLSR